MSGSYTITTRETNSDVLIALRHAFPEHKWKIVDQSIICNEKKLEAKCGITREDGRGKTYASRRASYRHLVENLLSHVCMEVFAIDILPLLPSNMTNGEWWKQETYQKYRAKKMAKVMESFKASEVLWTFDIPEFSGPFSRHINELSQKQMKNVALYDLLYEKLYKLSQEEYEKWSATIESTMDFLWQRMTEKEQHAVEIAKERWLYDSDVYEP